MLAFWLHKPVSAEVVTSVLRDVRERPNDVVFGEMPSKPYPINAPRIEPIPKTDSLSAFSIWANKA